MPFPWRPATAVALATVVAFGVPAHAHAPRDAKPGAPRMDLEVQITPPLAGSITPGGRDAIVAVDRFGNRFAVARKEVVGAVVSADPRARARSRVGSWQWWSADEGLTWQNLDLLARGAETFVPERVDRDLASDGARTYLAEVGPAGAVVTPVVATKRGRLIPASPGVVPVLSSSSSRPALAAHGGRTVLLASQTVTGSGSQVHASYDGGATWGPTASPLVGTACDLAADPRPGSKTVVATCLDGARVLLHTSLDDGRTFTTRALGATDSRGGDRGLPQVDIGPDGVPTVLSGLTLWRVTARGLTRQNLLSEKGDYRASTVAVSARGRVGVAAYRLLPGARGWNVVITVFSPGRAPVWSDFAFHDPAGRSTTAGPPSDRLSVDFDPLGQVHLVWTATLLHSAELDTPLLRNVWSVRSTTP